MANVNNSVIYTGITNDLKRRVYEHKEKKMKGFTAKYNVDKLVYYEYFTDIEQAINREKQIKGWVRQKKNDLINEFNEKWVDLFSELE